MMYKMKNILTLLSIILIGCTTINQLTVNSTISSQVINGDTSKVNTNKYDSIKDVQIDFQSVGVEKSNIVEDKNPIKNNLSIVNVTNNVKTFSSTDNGHVAYKIPNVMSLRTTYQVIVRISKSNMYIYDSLNGTVKTTIIPLTKTMEVKLIDPSPSDSKMFNIVTDNDSIQVIENNKDVTQWSWDVTPLRIGQAMLKIMVADITDEGKKEVIYEDGA